MKNIITALPVLQIDDSDSGKYSPEPVVSRPSKVLHYSLGEGYLLVRI